MSPEEKYLARKADWEEFHLENPHIYEIFENEVQKDIMYLNQRGLLFIAKVKLRRIFENIKWEGIQTDSKDGYLVNNDFYKFYAFQWEANHPRFVGVFEHRGFIPDSILKLMERNQPLIEMAKHNYNARKRSKMRVV